MGRAPQYIVIEELLEIIDDCNLRADIFGAAKICFILKPSTVLLSFTEIEVVVDPEDFNVFDKLVGEKLAIRRVKIEAQPYSPNLDSLLLYRMMYDYKYLVKGLGFLRIAVALKGPRNYFNPRRRVLSLTRYLRRDREAPPEYSFVAKLLIPSDIFDRCDCEHFIYGFMFSRDIYPWSPSKLLKIVSNVVRREPRYRKVILRNIAEIRECLKTRYAGFLMYEKKRAHELLRYLDKLQSILTHGNSSSSRF